MCGREPVHGHEYDAAQHTAMADYKSAECLYHVHGAAPENNDNDGGNGDVSHHGSGIIVLLRVVVVVTGKQYY